MAWKTILFHAPWHQMAWKTIHVLQCRVQLAHPLMMTSLLIHYSPQELHVKFKINMVFLLMLNQQSYQHGTNKKGLWMTRNRFYLVKRSISCYQGHFQFFFSFIKGSSIQMLKSSISHGMDQLK
uniref:Uncharacterized protein n=1 Tax=Aegilops tauschii subsp. strangulata TaxID=200361 RepID=A0A453LJT4_AEGTS